MDPYSAYRSKNLSCRPRKSISGLSNSKTVRRRKPLTKKGHTLLRLQNHRVEFRVARLSTRWNDSGLGLGSGLGLHFIELIYQLTQYCKSAGKFCDKKFRWVKIQVTRNSTRRSLKHHTILPNWYIFYRLEWIESPKNVFQCSLSTRRVTKIDLILLYCGKATPCQNSSLMRFMQTRIHVHRWRESDQNDAW